MRLHHSALVLSLLLAAAVAAAGCGGSSPAISVPSPSPPPSAIVSGGSFVASGSNGVTFAFSIGPGVAPGETGTVTVLPSPPPCVVPACSAVQPPEDGFTISVSPAPLAVSAFTSVALSGVPTSPAISMYLRDSNVPTAFTNFRPLTVTGGPLVVTDPASPNPVLTLAPGHVYSFAIWPIVQ